MPFKIYYLDDEADLLEMFVDAFAEPGIEITTFATPAEAQLAIKNCPPDLLILDYRLPKITGDQIALGLDPKILKVLITGDLSVSPKANFARIFHKPYTTLEMRDFLSECRSKKVA